MAAPSPDVFEKLSSFYLGRHFDLGAGKLNDDLLMYDAKDLCTHALCVGMTGSGKTGLCLSLLEEAAIDGIPAICVDPKGDLGNLMLSFPQLAPSDFEPWLEPRQAGRSGKTIQQFAADTAAMWRKGLQSWGQTPERIRKFKHSVDTAIYTPGSNSGIPMTVLKSFDAPPASMLDDSDAMRQRVTGAASGLLTLMGIEADPLLSREHILISSIFDHCWRNSQSVTIGDLIGLIQSPPIDRVGVLDLDSFLSPTDRGKLAMRLNNLLASPAFSTWLIGQPLNIQDLLYTPEGKPRLTILSIAHLSDRERMFFVTSLLNELLAWTRTQSGTSSLRAIFYMDEVAGYFPPVSNPPSKPPMLTLLKQARAYGLGITLATQNPVDLDYKGLSNIGTWFLGRLQTQRDKDRVLEGLEGAAVQSGQPFDRSAMGRILAGLGNRVFLMNNVHDDQPSIFQTRWAMSFLAGPIARDKISLLMARRKASLERRGAVTGQKLDQQSVAPSRPVAAAGIKEQFLAASNIAASNLPDSNQAGETTRWIYRPAIYGEATLHYVRSSADLDHWIDARELVPCGQGVPEELWSKSQAINADAQWLDQPEADFSFSELPTELIGKSNFKRFEKQFVDHLYRHRPMTLYRSSLLKQYAPAGFGLAEARNHFKQTAREELDRQTEVLRSKYADKMARLDAKLQSAQNRVDREAQQYQQVKVSSVISLGASILGAFLGNKVASRTNVSKMGTAMRGASRAAKEKGDVDRAESQLRQIAMDVRDLDARLQDDLRQLGQQYDVDQWELETTMIRPRKSDLKCDQVWLVWTPWRVDSAGIAKPLFETRSVF